MLKLPNSEGFLRFHAGDTRHWTDRCFRNPASGVRMAHVETFHPRKDGNGAQCSISGLRLGHRSREGILGRTEQIALQLEGIMLAAINMCDCPSCGSGSARAKAARHVNQPISVECRKSADNTRSPKFVFCHDLTLTGTGELLDAGTAFTSTWNLFWQGL
ncbi:hypothetical protein VUR80DRAFT_1997 [Thermomyces stellatus]